VTRLTVFEEVIDAIVRLDMNAAALVDTEAGPSAGNGLNI
jgi:hypothetical protein